MRRGWRGGGGEWKEHLENDGEVEDERDVKKKIQGINTNVKILQTKLDE